MMECDRVSVNQNDGYEITGTKHRDVLIVNRNSIATGGILIINKKNSSDSRSKGFELEPRETIEIKNCDQASIQVTAKTATAIDMAYIVKSNPSIESGVSVGV